MRAWCPSCQEERQAPFPAARLIGNRPVCGVCGAMLGAPPRERKPLKRKSAPKPPKAISAASAGQRAKVRHLACIVCGRDRHDVKIDPAHISPRGYPGGCEEPGCVVPLCREHHRAFDDGRLDLLPNLVGTWSPELAHALVYHYGGDIISLLQRVTGERYAPERRWREEAWQCYLAVGSDPDGADARHLNPGEAAEAVRELRAEYDAAVLEAGESE